MSKKRTVSILCSMIVLCSISTLQAVANSAKPAKAFPSPFATYTKTKVTPLGPGVTWTAAPGSKEGVFTAPGITVDTFTLGGPVLPKTKAAEELFKRFILQPTMENAQLLLNSGANAKTKLPAADVQRYMDTIQSLLNDVQSVYLTGIPVRGPLNRANYTKQCGMLEQAYPLQVQTKDLWLTLFDATTSVDKKNNTFSLLVKQIPIQFGNQQQCSATMQASSTSPNSDTSVVLHAAPALTGTLELNTVAGGAVTTFSYSDVRASNKNASAADQQKCQMLSGYLPARTLVPAVFEMRYGDQVKTTLQLPINRDNQTDIVNKQCRGVASVSSKHHVSSTTFLDQAFQNKLF